MLFPFPPLGWALLGIFVSGTNVSCLPRLTASSQVRMPAIRSTSFLLLPGKGPGNRLLSWISQESHPHFWAGHRRKGLSDWPGLGPCVHLCGANGRGGSPKRCWEDEKQRKESKGRKGGREEGKRKGTMGLLQPPKYLIIRCLTPVLCNAQFQLGLSRTIFSSFPPLPPHTCDF